MTTKVIKCTSCNIVINELLAFVQNKIDVMDEESLVRLCISSFTESTIEEAKSLLFDSLDKRKTTRKRGAMTVVISMVMAVGFFGYWGYGDESMAPVTMNFSRNWFSIILKVLMALVIYVTFALNFWVPFDLAWYYIKRKIKPEKYWFWHRFWRTVFVIGIVLITVAFPSVDLLIDVIGAFCLSNMGFIFPSLIELSVDWFDPGPGRFYWRLWKCVAICVFGAVLCIIGTTTSVISLIHELYG